MERALRWFALCGALAVAAVPLAAQGRGKGKAEATMSAAPAKGEATIIVEWFRTHQTSLPPGLSKKNALPPGLQKQLAKNGSLPPGLEKQFKPLPRELVVLLPPLPANHERVIVGVQVLVVDRTVQKILDIIDIMLP